MDSSSFKGRIMSNYVNGASVYSRMENADLINETNPEYKIPHVTEDINLEQNYNLLPMNTWAITAYGGTGYHTLGLDNYTLITTQKYANIKQDLTIFVATRVDDTIPSGRYSTSISFYAIANVQPNTIATTTYLQEMNETVASTMVEGENYLLKDIRDDKEYYVSKHNGIVSMMQNLEYASRALKDTSITASEASADVNKYVYKTGEDTYRNETETYVNHEGPADAEEANNKAGYYYSYAAAIQNSKDLNTYTGYTNISICPDPWRLPTYNEAEKMNNAPGFLTWSNNNGFFALNNTLRLENGQVYWTVDVDKNQKKVRAYIPGDSEPYYADARTLASIRCKYNPAFNFKADIVFDNETRTFNFSTDQTAINSRVDINSISNAKDYIGLTEDPDDTKPTYALSSFAGTNSLLTWLDIEKEENTLYAIKAPVCNKNAATIAEAVCMQDINSSVRKSMVINQQYRLVDRRDNQKYWVARLNDDRIWMTQDLNYYTTRKIEHDYDTNWEHKIEPYTENNVSYYRLFKDTVNSTVAKMDEGYYMKNGVIKTSLSEQQNEDEEHYNIGKYYAERQYSCPAKWRVGNYFDLMSALGITDGQKGVTNNMANVTDDILYNDQITPQTLLGAPLYLSLNGHKITEISTLQGIKGQYFVENDTTFNFAADGESVTIEPYSRRNAYINAFSEYYAIRCVADAKGLDDIEYMQDVTIDIAENTLGNTELQLKDKRDSKKYWIRKNTDGTVEMIQNLDFDVPTTGVTLNNETSDVGLYIESIRGWDPTWMTNSEANSYAIRVEDLGEQYLDNGTLVDSSSLPENAYELRNHIGNRYSQSAIMLGAKSGNYTMSICPKGWRLPFARVDYRTINYYNSTNDSFNYSTAFFDTSRFTNSYINTGYIEGNTFTQETGYNWQNNAYWFISGSSMQNSNRLKALRCVANTNYYPE